MNEPTFVVCIKAVPDPEGPRSAYEIRSDVKKVVPVGIPPVINPYDENGLELALSLKDQIGGRVIVLNLSEKAVVPVLKKAFSAGADELILLEDPAFANLTSYSIALVLSSAIKRIGHFNLVVTGRQAADWDGGQVGMLISEILKIPGISLAKKARIEDGRLIVDRLKRSGYEMVAAPIPALVTVSSEAGDLRLATLKAIQDAKKKPVTTWKATDLDIQPAALKTRTVRELTPPPAQTRTCLFVEGGSAADKALNLALRLKEDRVI
jgi:electron transfer flavoprotein beta subunit